MSASASPGESSGSGTGGEQTPTNIHDFQKSVNKRLDAMTDRQDSIQALSLWMIHHKTECQKIASCWLACMKRAKVSRRLHLFYLVNDVVQSCKKKNAKIYLLAFKNVLKDAVVLVRDASVKHKIERIFHIWEERNTYFIDFINELRELLSDREKVTAHVSATNFKPQDVLESIRKVKMLETHVGMKQKQVSNLKLDASKIEAVKQLKDRSHSHDFAKQFDDSYTKMSGYVKMLENEIEQRSKLIELLENGQTFYEVQNDDAMVVANAYRNFGIRINNLKKRLIEYKETLADDGDSPIPSPSAEAPSPGNTPPHDSPPDETEEMDMELSDSEENGGKIIAAEPYVPTPSTSSSLTDRLAALGGNVPGSDPRARANTESPGGYSPAEHLSREKAGNKANAIQMLSNLISAKSSQPAATRPDKSVLKNLTEFAEKVKNPPPVSWSDYKKKQQAKLEQQQIELEQRQQEIQRQLQEQEDQEMEEEEGGGTPVHDEPREDPEATEVWNDKETASPQQQSSQNLQSQPSAQHHTPLQGQTHSNQSENVQNTRPVEQYTPTAVQQDAVRHSQQYTPSIQRQDDTRQPQSSNVTMTRQAADEEQSMSWPPRSNDIPPVKTMALQNHPRMNTPPVRPAIRPHAQSNVRVIQQAPPAPRTTLAPHIQIQSSPVHVQPSPIRVRSPIRPQGVRPQQQGNVTVMSGPQYTPYQAQQQPGRRISSEAQQDALNLLDDIHAQSNNMGPRSHNGASAIQTLGQQNISPIPQRNMRPMVRPQMQQQMQQQQMQQQQMQQQPIMRHQLQPQQQYGYNNMRPPVKRPYQQYNNNPGYNNYY